MNKICTTVEQSKRLIELGIDINTADMLWTYDFMVGHINGVNIISELLKPEENDIPAWSLTGLLRTLPSASLDSSDDHHFRLYCMEKFSEWYDNPIDAVFEMIIRLKENGKI